jgi:hypothetical protein
VRDTHVKTKVNTRNDKNTIAQTRANMQVVHNLLGDDSQEEANYFSTSRVLAAA